MTLEQWQARWGSVRFMPLHVMPSKATKQDLEWIMNEFGWSYRGSELIRDTKECLVYLAEHEAQEIALSEDEIPL